MVLAMLSWGLSWTNAKIVGQYGEAPLIMVWRFLLAAISIAPILKLSKARFRIDKKDILLILTNSVFMVSYNYFYFKGTQIGLAGAGGVLVTTLNPILTVIFVNTIFGTKIDNKDIIGFMLGLLGGALIIRIWEFDLISILRSGNSLFY